ncbi:general stress protein [Bacillus sp. P14.5]|uniref:general stress protein n=1 Tax=Bacillus sp. P14.5 TaxID=1983400 RepID=UPI000DEA10C2|nr:general stress protein [Bacillus sp. P14.5]
MEKSIVGAYDSTAEVMDVINNLTKDGYTEDDILVISNREDISSLDNTSGLHVEHPSGDHEESRSMWEKIKDSFRVSEQHDNENRDLSQYNIPLNQVGTYQSKLEDGKILVAVTAKDKYALSHGGEIVDSGANIKPASPEAEVLEDDEMRSVNQTRNQTSTENYRTSSTTGKSVGNHGAEPEDLRSGNVDTTEDTIGGNVGNTLGGKLGTSERNSTGQEGLDDSPADQTEKEHRDEKNTENIDQKERFKANDYRGDF